MRSSPQDRQGAADPFGGRREDGRRESGRRPLLGVLVMAASLVLLAVAGVVALGVAVSHIHLDLGSIFGDADLSLPPPSLDAMDIALAPDGSRAYVTEPADDLVLVFDTGTGTVLARVPVGHDPTGLAVSPDDSQVWAVDTNLSLGGGGGGSGSGSDTGAPGSLGIFGASSVSVISTVTDSVVGTVAVGIGSIDVAFSPDGHLAYVTNNNDGMLGSGSVAVVDTATLKVVGTLAAPLPAATGWNPTSVAVTPDGRQVWVSAVSDLAGSPTAPDLVTVFDASTGVPTAEIRVGTGPFFMVLSRDGRDAYVADKGSCDVREIDTATLRVVDTVPWPVAHGCPFGLALGRDDDVVYTVTGSDHTFDQAHAGRAFGSVDFATSQADVLGDVGEDPVTVTTSGDATTAYVVDADRPVIDVVDPATGSVRSTFVLGTAPLPSTRSAPAVAEQ